MSGMGFRIVPHREKVPSFRRNVQGKGFRPFAARPAETGKRFFLRLGSANSMDRHPVRNL